MAPFGKTARNENFPVASWLVGRAERPLVMRYYAFARAADDVADAPHLSPAAKRAGLDGFEAGLSGGAGPADAAALREALARRGIGDRHARDLLVAFRRDAEGFNARSWADLLDYCAWSAHPVGRFLLELHCEPAELWPASDRLCAALQILNHVQDCGSDFRTLDRIYLPADWMAEAGVAPADLAQKAATPGLLRVLDRVIDGTDAMIEEASGLPGRIGNPRLAGEVRAVLGCARRLARRLRGSDPLAGRVGLSRADFALAGLAGAALALGRWRPGALRRPRPISNGAAG